MLSAVLLKRLIKVEWGGAEWQARRRLAGPAWPVVAPGRPGCGGCCRPRSSCRSSRRPQASAGAPGSRRRDYHSAAAPPYIPSAGVSIGMERERQQNDRTLVTASLHTWSDEALLACPSCGPGGGMRSDGIFVCEGCWMEGRPLQRLQNPGLRQGATARLELAAARASATQVWPMLSVRRPSPPWRPTAVGSWTRWGRRAWLRFADEPAANELNAVDVERRTARTRGERRTRAAMRPRVTAVPPPKRGTWKPTDKPWWSLVETGQGS